MKTIIGIQKLYPTIRFDVLGEYFDFKGGKDGDGFFDIKMYAEDLAPGDDRNEFEKKLNEFLETWFNNDYERKRYDELYAVFTYLMQCTEKFVFIGEWDEKNKKVFDESIFNETEKERYRDIDKSKYSTLADMEYDTQFKIRKETNEYQKELIKLLGLVANGNDVKLQQINFVSNSRNNVFKNRRILEKITSLLINGFKDMPNKISVMEKRAKRLPSDIYRAKLTLSLFEYVIKYIVPGRNFDKQNIYCFVGEILAYVGFANNLDDHLVRLKPKHYGKDSNRFMDEDKRNLHRYAKYLRKSVENWIKVGKTLVKT